MADEQNDAAVDETEAAADGSIFDTIDPVGGEAEAGDATDGDVADEPVDTTDDGAEELAAEADAGASEGDAEADADADDAEPEKPVSEAKKRADAIIAQRQVTRRTVTSKRVTPKAGAKTDPKAPAAASSKARNAKVTEQIQARYTPPAQTYAKGPSPWWVPAIMFGLLIVGALIIMLNYMGVFGDAENLRLVIGLAFILGGIITATQYR